MAPRLYYNNLKVQCFGVVLFCFYVLDVICFFEDAVDPVIWWDIFTVVVVLLHFVPYKTIVHLFVFAANFAVNVILDILLYVDLV